MTRREERYCPVQSKFLQTVEEASEYFGLGVDKIREITNDEAVNCVLYNGRKRLIKRTEMEKFLLSRYEI